MERPRPPEISMEAERAQKVIKRSVEKLPDHQPVESLRGGAGKESFEKATGILKDASAEKSHFAKATEILREAAVAAESKDADLAGKISEAVKNGDMAEAAKLMAEKAEREAKKE